MGDAATYTITITLTDDHVNPKTTEYTFTVEVTNNEFEEQMSEVTSGALSANISEISRSGKVYVEFSEGILVPDYSDFNNTQEPVLSLRYYNAENTWVREAITRWYVTTFNTTYMVVQLEFTAPYAVSASIARNFGGSVTKYEEEEETRHRLAIEFEEVAYFYSASLDDYIDDDTIITEYFPK